ncbi:hypothetical protein BH09MYX1_BH09MYX1_04340 [soil metagenome]
MIHTMMRYELTLRSVFDRARAHFAKTEIVTRRPNKEVVRHSFGDFSNRTEALARALLAMGLKKGERVATLSWNHYAHLEAYFAIPLAGGVLHTLNLRLHPDDICFIANHAKDRFLVVDDVLLPLVQKFLEKAPFEKIIVVPLTGQPVPAPFLDYEKVLADAPKQGALPTLAEEDPAGMC